MKSLSKKYTLTNFWVYSQYFRFKKLFLVEKILKRFVKKMSFAELLLQSKLHVITFSIFNLKSMADVLLFLLFFNWRKIVSKYKLTAASIGRIFCDTNFDQMSLYNWLLRNPFVWLGILRFFTNSTIAWNKKIRVNSLKFIAAIFTHWHAALLASKTFF